MTFVYLVAAIRRERRRLDLVLEATDDPSRGVPPAVAQLIRSARQDLDEAAAHLVALMEHSRKDTPA